jgi:hypothetical protein
MLLKLDCSQCLFIVALESFTDFVITLTTNTGLHACV